MRTFSNFAVSFTIISILSGCLTLFAFGMRTGGPAEMVWGWLVVGFFVTLVALGMAEVASSYPTAGGLYYWSAKLAKNNAPGLVVVHGLVQPARPGRRHRRHRLRPGVLHQRLPPHRLRGPDGPAGHDRDLRRRAVPPRAAEHVRHPARGPAERHLRVVARRGRRRDLRRDVLPVAAPHDARHRSSRHSSTGRTSTRRSRPLPAAVCRADRPAERPVHADRATTPRPTCPRRPTTPRPRRPAGSSSRSSSR